MTNTSADLRALNSQDAAKLLYSNTGAACLITLASSSVLAFGFANPDIYIIKQAWWFCMLVVLALRFVDGLYWRRIIKPQQDFDGDAAQVRFGIGCIATAIIWAAFPLLTFSYVTLLEFSVMIIVLSSMAAGGQSVLAANARISISYALILLVPISIMGVISDENHRVMLGSLGLVFSIGLVFTYSKAVQFTLDSINTRNVNMTMSEQLRQEKQQLDKVNQELSDAYDKLNIVNNTLEEQVSKRTEKIAQLSYLDPLTQLMNRKAFTQSLSKLAARAEQSNSELALLFIDLDGFKKINDTMGHQVGDSVLQEVTRRISAFSDDNKIGRWTGDEFLVALPYSDAPTAKAIASAIITSISQAISVNNNSVHLGATVGIAMCPEHSTEATELIQFADLVMSEQKVTPDRTPVIFSNELQQRVIDTQAILEGLQQATGRRQLYLCYQPIVSAKDTSFCAFEALLRWDFDGRFIGPDQFIPLAEKSGLIKEMGAWVLNRACMDASQWQYAHDAAVSVNVSIIQLMDDSFIRALDNALRSSGLAPERLHLEITESIFVDNKIKIKQQLEAIQARKVHVSIDDFGTGYSSLSQLQTLSVNQVKIDKSFIDNMHNNGEAIIRATLFIASELNCKTVAEGVETLEQALALKAMGVDYLQGFYFAKPMRNEQLIEWQNPITDTTASPAQAK
ncbi:putative bifunctional diguanylate cyclase/phosphodiesterase [Paraglaciecola chathamensis]|uniref:putative bifunctional diguanylate cyclase/phosphodiesterase n=1 Tax=Paraglaciecola chathamensis TaxID=368405 RepID=UPI0026FBE134|nr:EAL domain-containing protein [Paraglaciecola chathamensis]MDO6557997.1 EAL domain-containing protein [Paraglaciecola chathamensis]